VSSKIVWRGRPPTAPRCGPVEISPSPAESVCTLVCVLVVSTLPRRTTPGRGKSTSVVRPCRKMLQYATDSSPGCPCFLELGASSARHENRCLPNEPRSFTCTVTAPTGRPGLRRSRSARHRALRLSRSRRGQSDVGDRVVRFERLLLERKKNSASTNAMQGHGRQVGGRRGAVPHRSSDCPATGLAPRHVDHASRRCTGRTSPPEPRHAGARDVVTPAWPARPVRC